MGLMPFVTGRSSAGTLTTGTLTIRDAPPSSLRRLPQLVYGDTPELRAVFTTFRWHFPSGAPAGTAFSRIFFIDGGRVVKGLGDRIALGVNTAEQFDLAFRPLQKFVRLPQQLYALLILLERLVETDLACFERVNDLVEPFQRLLKGKLTWRVVSGLLAHNSRLTQGEHRRQARQSRNSAGRCHTCRDAASSPRKIHATISRTNRTSLADCRVIGQHRGKNKRPIAPAGFFGQIPIGGRNRDSHSSWEGRNMRRQLASFVYFLISGSLLIAGLTGCQEGAKPAAEPTKSAGAADQQTLNAIWQLGGTVEIDDTVPGDPVVALDLKHCKFNDDDLAPLAILRALRRIDLSQTSVTDAGLAHLKGLTELTTLDLSDTPIRGTGLENVKDAKLERLWLYRSSITDAGLAPLKHMTGLSELDVSSTKISDPGLEPLHELTNLTSLYLNNTKITDLGLSHLKGLTKLEELRLSLTGITDAGLESLGGMTELTSLSLFGTKITDAGLAHLKGMGKLQELNLGNTQIGNAGIMQLKELKNLRILKLVATPVNKDGEKALQTAMPELTILR